MAVGTKTERRRCHCGHGYTLGYLTEGRRAGVVKVFHDDPLCDAVKELSPPEFIAHMVRRRGEVFGHLWNLSGVVDPYDRKELKRKVRDILATCDSN